MLEAKQLVDRMKKEKELQEAKKNERHEQLRTELEREALKLHEIKK